MCTLVLSLRKELPDEGLGRGRGSPRYVACTSPLYEGNGPIAVMCQHISMHTGASMVRVAQRSC